jgi:hypothetical protein
MQALDGGVVTKGSRLLCVKGFEDLVKRNHLSYQVHETAMQ